jgi:ribonuclease HI
VKALGHQNFIIRSDSKVIRDHVEKYAEARKPELIEYLEAVRAMEKHFKGFDIVHIPRALNGKADKLAKAAFRKEPLPPDVFFEEIT